MADQTLDEYKQNLRARLAALNTVFANASIGDFSHNVKIPEQEDELTEFLVGIQLMIEVVREKTAQLEAINAGLEKVAAEREEFLQQIVNNSTNLFYIHDDKDTLLYISPQSQHYFGLDPESAKTKWTDFVTDNPINKKGIEITKLALKTGKVQPEYELELKGKKDTIWVLVNEKPIVKNGKVTGLVGSLTDITKRKLAEQALNQRAAELERLNKLMIGRELRMVELKKELEVLRGERGATQ